MTLTALLAAVYEDTGYQTTPAAAVTTRLTRYLNEGLQAIVAEPDLSGVLDANEPYTFSSVASTPKYVVPEAVAALRLVRDVTNNRTLQAIALADYRRRDPDPSETTGVPVAWVPLGQAPVAKSPSNASEIFIKSTSASDTNTAYLDVILTGGYRRSLSVSMTGVTAVTFSASVTTVESIEDFYLSAAAVGTVTLHEDSGSGTELARITIGALQPRYQAFYLWPTPSGAYDYSVDYRRELDLLVNGTDEPPLPQDFHPMLVKYAAFREWEMKDDDRAKLALQQYGRWLSRLKYRLRQSDALPVAKVTKGLSEHSRLGGWYPADTWR